MPRKRVSGELRHQTVLRRTRAGRWKVRGAFVWLSDRIDEEAPVGTRYHQRLESLLSNPGFLGDLGALRERTTSDNLAALAVRWEVLERDLAELVTPSPAEDPHYDQHLDFVLSHPGFRAEVQRLRLLKRPRFAAVAHTWQLTIADLKRIIASDSEAVALDPEGPRIFVEYRPAEWVVHIPRPMTQQRKATLERWAAATQNHAPSAARPESRLPSDRLAPGMHDHLRWYQRWLGGESARDIAESVRSVVGYQPVSTAAVRSALRHVHDRMKQISPQGLPPGP